MADYSEQLEWLETQQAEMEVLVKAWSNINSGTLNVSGVNTMGQAVVQAFSVLGPDTVERVDLEPLVAIGERGEEEHHPLGRMLFMQKRSQAPIQVMLGAHLDTVYGAEHPFQKATAVDINTLQGPGVADIKGGIVVMYKALEALERSPYAEKVGWTIFLSPDEEMGSPSSAAHLIERAGGHQLGLIFEPSLPDGSLIKERKGSGNLTVVAEGKAAHVGREPEAGRNAIAALASFASVMQKLFHYLI